jgi:hypothetical protein
MLLAHPSLRLFGAPFPSLVLAPRRVHSVHHDHELGRASMAVFDRRKGGYIPEGFF